MGYRFTQSIKTCSECGRTPEDGEHMWWMDGKPMCEECSDSCYGDDDNEQKGDE